MGAWSTIVIIKFVHWTFEIRKRFNHTHTSNQLHVKVFSKRPPRREIRQGLEAVAHAHTPYKDIFICILFIYIYIYYGLPQIMHCIFFFNIYQSQKEGKTIWVTARGQNLCGQGGWAASDLDVMCDVCERVLVLQVPQFLPTLWSNPNISPKPQALNPYRAAGVICSAWVWAAVIA